MTLEERIERLERANRRLMWLLITVCLSFSAVFLMGQARPPQRITASEFVVVNASGTEVAKLGTYGDDGMPSLSLTSPLPNRTALEIGYIKKLYNLMPGDPPPPGNEFEPRISMWSARPQSNTSVGLDIGLDLSQPQPWIALRDDSGRVFWTAP